MTKIAFIYIIDDFTAVVTSSRAELVNECRLQCWLGIRDLI